MPTHRLLADEQFPAAIVNRLRTKCGHDIQTVRQHSQNKAGDGMLDREVLELAHRESRAVLTRNVSDFVREHRANSNHSGIVCCAFSDAEDAKRIAAVIDNKLRAFDSLAGELIQLRRSDFQKKKRKS